MCFHAVDGGNFTFYVYSVTGSGVRLVFFVLNTCALFLYSFWKRVSHWLIFLVLLGSFVPVTHTPSKIHDLDIMIRLLDASLDECHCALNLLRAAGVLLPSIEAFQTLVRLCVVFGSLYRCVGKAGCENRLLATSCLSVCPHKNKATPTGRIFVKFRIFKFCQKLSTHSDFG
jgi:hypothetical protein